MIPKSVSMANYRECDGVVRVFNGIALPIVDVQLLNVAFVPILSHNLLSLKQFLRRAGHSYLGDSGGVTFFSKSGMSGMSRTKRKCKCNNRPRGETPQH